MHREQEADRHPRRRDRRHDDRQPAAPPLRPDEAEIHVVDRDDRHVYQPGLLFVPFGLAHVEEIVRPRRRQLRRGVVFHQNEVDEVWTERDEVLLDDGTVLPTTCSWSPPACACSRRRPRE